MAVNPEKRFLSVEELHAGLYHPDDTGFFYPPEDRGGTSAPARVRLKKLHKIKNNS